jgi:hypothetical protein
MYSSTRTEVVDVAHVHPRHLALLLAAALATLCIALAMSSSSASASPFCGGQTVQRNRPCFGAQRNMSGDTGFGRETSICIGANEINGPCSGGPNQMATLNIGTFRQAVPWITGNALSTTVVFGETF